MSRFRDAHDPAGHRRYTLAWVLVLIALGSGMSYCAWMAAFTETVEERPAATATGLAVYGYTVHTVVCLSLLALVFAVPASTLIDKGTKVSEIAEQYPDRSRPSRGPNRRRWPR